MKKRLSLIISVIVIFGILVGVTLALFGKEVFSQNVSFNVEGINITYQAGDNITGVKLIPVTTLAKGLTDGTAIEKQITVSSTTTNYFSLYLDVEILDNGLKRDYVKYQINKGNNIVNSGNFAGAGAGTTITLLSDEKIDSTTSTYTLYIWIDGSVDNDEDVENQNYKFILRADATNKKPVLASEKIIQLAGNCTSYESGFEGICATNPYEVNGETKYHEYRYIGAEPNNYVKFNNDLYQIIGIFDKNSYDIESVENNDYGDYLVKLISANELTAAAWGAYNSSPDYTTYSAYSNNWDGLDSEGNTTNGTGVKASANVLLNEFFLNPTKTSTYGECINWTYGSNNNTYKSKNCTNIKGYGIQTEALRNYIQPVTWYLYGYTSGGLNKDNWYKCERNNYAGCTSGNSGAYSGKTTASIGLMYVSDYLYASGYVASNAIYTNGSSSNFMSLNWLYNGQEWTITPEVNLTSREYFVYNNGYITDYNVFLGVGIRPTFYLKSSIKIKSGEGTFESPYIIG